MNPAHIFLFLALVIIIPFLAGAFILAILAILDNQIFPEEVDDEKD